MGLIEPGLWVLVTAAVTACGLAFRLIGEKIHADRDKALVELALRDTAPGDRRDILEGLAELRPLNAHAAHDDDAAMDLAPALSGKLRQKRRRRPADER